jgi:uncharacterized membrane protein
MNQPQNQIVVKQNPLTKSKKSQLDWWQASIIVVLLLGICLRFVNLDGKVYWIDEVHTSLRSSAYTRTDFQDLVPKNQVITIEDLHQLQNIRPETGLPETIKALASSEHSPLYYLMARFWLEWFGSSPTVTRSLAAVISLLAFPCIYWLCLELFSSPLVGWIAMGLLAVSPVHLLYAQEAREYSLLTVTILLSSATFLWTIRKKTSTSWIIYTLTVALGLYSHPVIGLVFLGHGIYLLVTEKFKFTETFKKYIIASLAGLTLFFPWILVFIFNGDYVSWVVRDIPFATLIQRWLLNLSAIFFDLQAGYQEQLFNVETGQDIQLGYDRPLVYLIIPIFWLVSYSFYFLYRHGSQKSWLFISLSLIGVTAITLVLPDVLTGGQRSKIARYVIACLLGVQLAVAYCLATKINPLVSRRKEQKIWRLITVTILSLGMICCAIVVQAPTWWNKYSSYYNPQVAAIINQAEKPLVISNKERVSRITSLSYMLDEKVRLLLVRRSKLAEIPDGFSDVFLFRPYTELLEDIKQNQNYQLEPIYQTGHLWRVEK